MEKFETENLEHATWLRAKGVAFLGYIKKEEPTKRGVIAFQFAQDKGSNQIGALLAQWGDIDDKESNNAKNIISASAELRGYIKLEKDREVSSYKYGRQ